ncbi:macro domain-containing protein [Pseudoalteromonas luteoviolacea]|uniref:macro domain-containing protein n=1 Tax=Pseudoalteromonas luteoviolacea TaxID=43657 RepID=UPI00351E7D85
MDVIVNAANPKMLGGGGVDGAIHRAAGPKLLEACKKIKSTNGVRCPFGEARITIAGNLPAKYVIHTVGPIYRQAQNPEATLKSAYFNSLQLAVENDCKSIAFPAISCGAYGYPLEEAAHIAVSTSMPFVKNGLRVVFYLFDESLVKIWKEAVSQIE